MTEHTDSVITALAMLSGIALVQGADVRVLISLIVALSGLGGYNLYNILKAKNGNATSIK